MAEPQQPQPPEPSDVIAVLTITMDRTGNVNVNGPIENRVLCYGLLEIAKDTLFEFAQKQNSGRIIQPPAGSFLRKP